MYKQSTAKKLIRRGTGDDSSTPIDGIGLINGPYTLFFLGYPILPKMLKV